MVMCEESALQKKARIRVGRRSARGRGQAGAGDKA